MILRLAPMFLLLAHIAVAVDTLPVEDIKPGMRGKTLTVMQGTEIVELETELLGVLENGLGPGFDLIIGKLVDKKTELTGAVHGMSGSPLYVDGKLVGALSRRVTMFEKDGHCGFTPIADMLDVGRREPKGTPNYRSGLAHGFGALGLPEGAKVHHDALALPLSITGWKESWNPLFSKVAGSHHTISPVMAGAASSAKEFPLQPGSPLAIPFITGDLTAAGTGTLTYLDGKKLLAFGHAMFGIGQVIAPVASAEIITTVPSYAMPFKMANTGHLAGRLYQDRLSAVAGVLGDPPPMASYSIKRVHNGEARPDLNGHMVDDPNIAPFALGALLLQSMMNEQDASKRFTLSARGEILFKNLPPLKVNILTSGDGFERIVSIISLHSLLNDFYRVFPERMQLESLHLTIHTHEAAEIWRIESFTSTSPPARPTETLHFNLSLESDLGHPKMLELSATLPEEIREGIVQARIVTGADIAQREASRLRLSAFPSPREVINQLNREHRLDAFVLELVAPANGIVQDTQEQPALPASVLDVMSRTQNQGRISSSHERILFQLEIPVKGFPQGQAALLIPVKP